MKFFFIYIYIPFFFFFVFLTVDQNSTISRSLLSKSN